MTTLQTEYEDTTEAIDSVITSGLSSVLDWINIPGGLTKVASSEAGLVWGFNGDNSVWSCTLPCTGNWKMSDLTGYSIETILDIAADNITVYILCRNTSGNTILLSTPANRQGIWSSINVPFSATKIFSTHTYIWAQDGSNNKQMCPKPCTMSNWIPSSESTITITSSTDTHLYGKDAQGNPMQTDEVMRSGWSPISSFGETKVSSVIGGTDVVYAVDTSSNVIRSDGKILPTKGYQPSNLTVSNNQLWMTSVTPGLSGNIFTRTENPDYMKTLNTIAPLDQRRDKVIEQVESKFNEQTNIMTINKQSKDIIDFFKNLFKLDKDTSKKAKAQAGHITEQIRSTQEQLDRINDVEPAMKIAVITLFAIMLVYLVLSGIFGWITHIFALIMLGIGSYFIFKNK